MPRKKKVKNLFQTINLEKQIEGSPITKENLAFNIVNWGQTNDYPLLLLNLYNNSPVHHACINFAVKSIVGKGIDYDELNGTDIATPNPNSTWDQLLYGLSLDFKLYGTFCIQVIKNRGGNSFSFYHIPAEQVRWTQYNEDGKITKYYICPDWTNPVMNPPEEVEAFETADDVRVGKKYLYVYKQYSPANTYYTSPTYTAAITAIQADIEYNNFDYRHITNSFSPAGLLTLPPVETEEQKQQIIKEVQHMFAGSNNTNSVMIQFSNGIDSTDNIKFTPFASDNTADDYANANDRVVNRILAAHSIPSRALIGMPLENNGFASEAAILANANDLYQTLVGETDREIILKTINNMLQMNGIEEDITIKPLVFAELNNI